MQLYESLFLEALKASVKNEKVSWCEPISINVWEVQFKLAEKQKVLPLIFQAVYDCQALKQVDEQLFLRIMIIPLR